MSAERWHWLQSAVVLKDQGWILGRGETGLNSFVSVTPPPEKNLVIVVDEITGSLQSIFQLHWVLFLPRKGWKQEYIVLMCVIFLIYRVALATKENLQSQRGVLYGVSTRLSSVTSILLTSVTSLCWTSVVVGLQMFPLAFWMHVKLSPSYGLFYVGEYLVPDLTFCFIKRWIDLVPRVWRDPVVVCYWRTKQ